jgi:hypothetical protein
VVQFWAFCERKHKVPPAYSHPNPRKTGAARGLRSRADLPIRAKTGREWGPDSARSLYGRRDDEQYRGRGFKLYHYPTIPGVELCNPFKIIVDVEGEGAWIRVQR